MSQRRFGFDQPLQSGEILAVMPQDGSYVTRREIALALMRKKSPTFLNLLNEMVAARLLTVQLVPLPNGVDMFTYALWDVDDPELLGQSE